MLHKTLISTVLFFLSFQLTLAQNPGNTSPKAKDFTTTIEHWKLRGNLPTWKIAYFLEDSKGLLWIGTDLGLFSFDGYQFHDRTESVKGRKWILQMVEDKQHNIWFVTSGEGEKETVMVLNTETETVMPAEEFAQFDKPLGNGHWELYQYNGEIGLQDREGNYYRFKDKPSRSHCPYFNPFARVLPGKNENFWAYLAGEMPNGPQFSLVNGQGKKLKEFDLDSFPAIRIWQDRAFNFWAIYGDALEENPDKMTADCHFLSIDEEGIHPLAFDDLPATAFLLSYQIIENGIYINDKGINAYLGPIREELSFLYKHKILQLEIAEEKTQGNLDKNKFYVANDGSFWTCNKEALLKITIETTHFTNYLDEEESMHSMRGIAMGNDSFLYANCYKGAKKINPTTGESIPFDFKKSKTGLALLADGNHFWITNHHQHFTKYHYDGTSEHYDFEDHSADVILATKKQLLVGASKGLYRLDTLSKQLKLFSLDSIIVSHLYQNEEGIWAATESGLFLVDEEGTLLAHHFKPGFKEENWKIRFIHEDAEGHFWMATENGLIDWDKKNQNYTHYTTTDGLSHHMIHAVYEDKMGMLWLPSDFGLMAFNKKSKSIRTYYDSDGLPHNEFNTLSHFQDKEGRLYFGGLNGITSFLPEDLHLDETDNLALELINCTITNGQTGEKLDKTVTLRQNEALTLSPSENFVAIKVSSYVYKNDLNIEYGWRIAGKQKDWIVQRSNIIQLNVDYGQNDLEIVSRYIGNEWSRKKIQQSIIREKPFYMRWDFLVVMLLSIILSIILSIFLFFRQRTRKLKADKVFLENEVKSRTAQIVFDKQTIEEQAEELKKMDEIKSRFFSNITHEFRTPLTLINGPVSQLLEEKLPTKIKTKLKGVQRNGRRLLNLINQLLDLSKLESGSMQLEVYHGDIIAFAKELVLRFSPLAHSKQQQLSFVPNLETWETFFDKEKLSKIIYNLVSNAIKYTPEKGHIYFYISNPQQADKAQIVIKVKDTGIGIPAELVPHIFDRFYQADNSLTRKNEGTGIGLALVKELIEFQNGKISIQSEAGKGSVFTVTLPVLPAEELSVSSKTTFDFPELINITPLAPNEKATPSPNKKDKLVLLIIEDNAEMRIYIKQCINETDFIILEAVNGAEGISLAKEQIPDLIISDVMMPIKDGFEVTKAIRINVKTSHIPLILLTAKASLESRLKGIERGADAYLTKPFNPQELRLRIQKLIETRRLLQLYYQNGKQVPVEESTMPFTKEHAFLKEARDKVVQQLNSSSLNGESLAKELFMSRMQLHRKLKAITDQSTSEFIREIRLEHAYELLKKRQGSVSEIAYQTGFNTPSYFSKSFKEKYHISPSQVQN